MRQRLCHNTHTVLWCCCSGWSRSAGADVGDCDGARAHTGVTSFISHAHSSAAVNTSDILQLDLVPDSMT